MGRPAFYGRLIACLIALACTRVLPLWAAEGEAGESNSALSLRWENDALGGTDENYTNGTSLAFTNRGSGLVGGVWNLFGDPEGKRFSTYELSQLEFTPSDLRRSDPDPTDRPYAGLLYLGLTTHLKQDDSLHSLKLIAGVVGPASLNEEAQNLAHHAFGYTEANGWSHQLKNEPIVNLLYEYRHRYPLTSPNAAIGIELIPMGGAMLGNYLTQAQGEVQLRVGYQLPDDFGTTVLRGVGYLPFPQPGGTGKTWGAYLFAGAGASLIGRNITLDGNSFAKSGSVDKRIFLPMGEYGASLWARHFQASFSYIMWGREFYGQKAREDYGSVLLTYIF